MATTSPGIDISASKPVFSWQSPEFMRYEKDKKWSFYVVLISVILIGVFVLLKQWSGAALILVASIVLSILSNAKPKTVKCAIYNEGVVVNEKVYTFTQFKKFWISGTPDLPKIVFQLTGAFSGIVNLPMQNEDPEQIRLFLVKHVPEETDHVDDVSEVINRIFRF